MRMSLANRHQGLAGAALPNDANGACRLQMFRQSGDGQRLRGQRLSASEFHSDVELPVLNSFESALQRWNSVDLSYG